MPGRKQISGDPSRENLKYGVNAARSITFEELPGTVCSVREDTKATEANANNKQNNEHCESAGAGNRRRKSSVFRSVRIGAIIIFVISSGLFANEVFIQPYLSDKVIKEVQDVYQAGQEATPTPGAVSAGGQTISDTQATAYSPDPDRDSQGRLLVFRDLLNMNGDFKGWITIPDTKVDYPVLQSGKDMPEYYLTSNFSKKPDKRGSIFMDVKSSVEDDTQNIVLYGHNMTVSGTMFHDIVGYHDLDFYKKRPVIKFDTIYRTGRWKVFSVFVTNGSSKYEKLFDYTRSTFADSSDFLNFVYQLRVRSLLNINVDVNESDQLLTLSTCSYELENYRTVVVARRVREGEDPGVDVDSAVKNKNPLYPQTWYDTYGGAPPKVTSFEEALKAGEITWYKPANN